MYQTPGITTGIGSGAAGAGALAMTGATTFAYVVAGVTLIVGGLLLLRTTRMRRAATTQD